MSLTPRGADRGRDCACSSMVEPLPSKQRTTGSIPARRSKFQAAAWMDTPKTGNGVEQPPAPKGEKDHDQAGIKPGQPDLIQRRSRNARPVRQTGYAIRKDA